MEPTLQRIRQENAQRASQGLSAAMHSQQVAQIQQLEKSMLGAIAELLRYLDGKTTKTEVINQLTEIGTPDVANVVKSLSALNETVESTRIDLSPLQNGLAKLEAQLVEIPKSHPEQKDAIQVTNLKTLESNIASVEKAIKKLDLHVEAPVVNVPQQLAPIVNVDKPDLSPLRSVMLDMIAAVKAIEIPDPAKPVSLTKLEKESEKANKLLKEIRDKPQYGGGGSGGVSSYVKPDGSSVYADTVTSVVGSKNAVVVVNPDGTNIGGGSGGGGDATAANQVTQTTRLTSIRDQQTDGTQKTQVTNFPATQPVSGTVAVSNPFNGDVSDRSGRLLGQVSVSGTVTISGSVTVSNFPASQNVVVTSIPEIEIKNDTGNPIPVNGTVTTNKGTGWVDPQTNALTDTQLRASPVPISNTNLDVALSTRLKPADTLTKVATVDTITNVVHVDDNGGSLTVDGAVSVNNFPASQAVTGTFFQATQPVSIAATVNTKGTQPSSSAVTSVANATSSTSILASNANRRMATFYNDDTLNTGAVVRLKLGTTASNSSFTIPILPGGYYELPQPVYTGAIDAIASAATGNLRVTELS